jgi:hypothetical protein
MQEGITASDATQEGSQSFHRKIKTAEAAAASAAYSEYLHHSLWHRSDIPAAEALFSNKFLCAWLDRTETDVHLWGTLDDPHNPPPAPPQGLGDLSSGSTWGMGTWGSGGGWSGGWNLVALNGGWDGGWNAGNAVPYKTRLWFTRFYGFCRMGAVFRCPRLVGWEKRCWQRQFGWVWRLERKWRRQESTMLLLSS